MPATQGKPEFQCLALFDALPAHSGRSVPLVGPFGVKAANTPSTLKSPVNPRQH